MLPIDFLLITLSIAIRRRQTSYYSTWAEVSINRYMMGYLSDVLNIGMLRERLLSVKTLPLNAVMQNCCFCSVWSVFWRTDWLVKVVVHSLCCQGEWMQASLSPLPNANFAFLLLGLCFPFCVKSSYRRWVESKRCFHLTQLLRVCRFFSGQNG